MFCGRISTLLVVERMEISKSRFVNDDDFSLGVRVSLKVHLAILSRLDNEVSGHFSCNSRPGKFHVFMLLVS